MKIVKYLSLIISCCILLAMTSCGKPTKEFDPTVEFDVIAQQAGGQTVIRGY